MHELSIAGAILERAVAHTPGGATLESVHVVAGPLRGIDEGAMQAAWISVTHGTTWRDVGLELEQLPWRLRCRDCGREFAADDVGLPCACGSSATSPVGGDELQITSLTVSDPAAETSEQGT
jgi:hydrogenase nickel incorporation protein HypA/HybF